MPSLSLIIICVFTLSFSTGLTQELNSVQDFAIPTDDQPPDFLTSQTLVASLPAQVPDLEDSSFTDITGSSGFGDPSLFTDIDISDFNDPTFSSGILEASCSNNNNNNNGVRPSKLRARQGVSCINPSAASNQGVSKSKPPLSNAGDAVGVMTSETNWCVDLQFALYHTVAVCDELHTGYPHPSGYHYAVYPSSLIKLINLFSCPEERIYCCMEWVPNSVMTSPEISAQLEFGGDDIGAGFDCVHRL